jgi:hypothetical protein
MGGEQKIFQDFRLVRLHQGGIDVDALHVALGGQSHRHQAAAGRAHDLDHIELGMHRLHLVLEFAGLLHQTQNIRHGSLSS